MHILFSFFNLKRRLRETYIDNALYGYTNNSILSFSISNRRYKYLMNQCDLGLTTKYLDSVFLNKSLTTQTYFTV